ncbi:hypothetical protein PC120_g18788 [Phytophthora cactorum]|nr:hypothetical protein PC120_g18788 [Phytophthora cactorum]
MPCSPNAKNLPLSVRLENVFFLLDMATCRKLPPGPVSEAAAIFSCHRNTVYKLWSGRTNIAVQRRSYRSRPRALIDGELKVKIEAAPKESRTTLRCIAASTGVARTQLFRRLKERSVTAMRRQFAWSFVEKLPDRTTYYLTSDETALRAVTKNKNHRTTVMVLVAVARPRYDAHQRMTFDGKVGLWPVVETKLAVRNSKNRPKGTPVTTPNEMTDDVYGRMLTQLVIPAIKRVWPGK